MNKDFFLSMFEMTIVSTYLLWYRSISNVSDWFESRDWIIIAYLISYAAVCLSPNW